MAEELVPTSVEYGCSHEHWVTATFEGDDYRLDFHYRDTDLRLFAVTANARGTEIHKIVALAYVLDEAGRSTGRSTAFSSIPEKNIPKAARDVLRKALLDQQATEQEPR